VTVAFATKAITIIEDGADRVRSIYIEPNGSVRVFDKDRKFRFGADLTGAETTWQILARISSAIVAAEARAIKIEALADRCRTGLLPVAGEIDPVVPQRTLVNARFALDLLRYPDDPDLAQYSRATLLMGRDEAGRTLVTGEILWIAADRSYAVCEDGLWWTPADSDARPGDDEKNEG
jgi:hypothetical protein